VAQWAAEPILAADTSVASVVTSLAVAGSADATLTDSPSVAAASSAQALASSQLGRIGGMTIGVTVACHGGSGRHPGGANAYASPIDERLFLFVKSPSARVRKRKRLSRRRQRRRVRDDQRYKPHGAIVTEGKGRQRRRRRACRPLIDAHDCPSRLGLTLGENAVCRHARRCDPLTACVFVPASSAQFSRDVNPLGIC
jgi:hypothetical protein